jgi:hypothetical protein
MYRSCDVVTGAPNISESQLAAKIRLGWFASLNCTWNFVWNRASVQAWNGFE